MQTLLETFRPDERRLVSVQLSPYLEWWVADGRRRERLSRSDVGFDAPETMLEAIRPRSSCIPTARASPFSSTAWR